MKCIVELKLKTLKSGRLELLRSCRADAYIYHRNNQHFLSIRAVAASVKVLSYCPGILGLEQGRQFSVHL